MQLTELSIDMAYFGLVVFGDFLIITAGAFILVSLIDGLISALRVIKP